MDTMSIITQYVDLGTFTLITTFSAFILYRTPILTWKFFEKKGRKAIFVMLFSVLIIAVNILWDVIALPSGTPFDPKVILWPKLNAYFIATSFYELIIKQITIHYGGDSKSEVTKNEIQK